MLIVGMTLSQLVYVFVTGFQEATVVMLPATLYIPGMSLACMLVLNDAKPTIAHPPPDGTVIVLDCVAIGISPTRVRVLVPLGTLIQ